MLCRVQVNSEQVSLAKKEKSFCLCLLLAMAVPAGQLEVVEQRAQAGAWGLTNA